jgi:hypothetical protein
MGWHKISKASPPTERPIMVRTAESEVPVVAFLSADGVWHIGGALVQTARTILAATPTESCEPSGDEAL